MSSSNRRPWAPEVMAEQQQVAPPFTGGEPEQPVVKIILTDEYLNHLALTGIKLNT